MQHFGHITAGDLSRPVEIRSQDEMGQLLSGIAKMQDGLAQTVLSVRTGSETIAAATRQIAAGNVDLSSAHRSSKPPRSKRPRPAWKN
ncbi:HAMP domain-containing protein [Cupriavidus basilensis]